MKKFLFLLIILIPTLLFAQANLEKAILSTKKDIEEATAELNKLREEITSQRLKISEELDILREEVLRLREEYKNLKGELEGKDLGEILKEVNYLEEEIKFSSSLLKEFRREMETYLPAPEVERNSTSFKKIDKILETSPLKATPFLLNLARKIIEENIGGNIFEGRCLDQHGVSHKGNFIVFGPISYFSSQDIAGMVGFHTGSALPSVVYSLPRESLTKLVRGERSILPLDFTLGEAIKVKRYKKTWQEHIISGGVVMIPILALGFICLILIIYKFFSLSRIKTRAGDVLKEIINLVKEGKTQEAKEKVKSLGRPFSPVFLEVIEHKDATREDIEEITHERILSQLPFLQSHLPTLAVSASAAPLLGLLGTVTGMIHTFNLVTLFGTGQAKLLSGGISEALVTTEFGLAIAIPVLLIHAYLSRRVRKIIDNLEVETLSLINGIKGTK